MTASAADAQKPKIETFTMGDGLPSSVINDLAQDPSGRLWILTQSGITTYDGRAFSAPSTDGLPEDELAKLVIDARGQAWTVTKLTGPHVYALEGSTWRRLPEAEVPRLRSADQTTALAVLPGGDRSVVALGAARSGLLIWDGTRWWRYRETDSLPSDRVVALAAFGDAIAVGTEAGLCFVEARGPDCSIRDRELRLRERILALRPVTGTPARLWILADAWLGYLETGRLTVVADDLPLPSPGLWAKGALLPDAIGGVYFGIPQTAFFLDPDRHGIRELGLYEGLATVGATALLLDRESNVWIGGSRGLNLIESRRFLSFDQDQGLLEDEVSAIAEPAPGELVLGHNTGLTLVDGHRVETLHFDRPPAASIDAFRVMDTALDRDGAVWLAAHQGGLLRLDKDRTLSGHSPASRIYSVELDIRGRLWACSLDTLFVRDGADFSPVDHGLGDVGLLRWIEAGPEGNVYVSTSRGLLWRDAQQWRLAHGPTTEADLLYGLLAEPSGALWVGTRAGLYELRKGELVKVRRGELEIDDPVYLVFADGRGQAWFGTDDGVRVWDGHRLRHLSVRHGLAGRETNRGAGLVDDLGRVWIGTDRGVSMYQERYDTGPTAAPVVEIDAIEVDGIRQDLTGEVTLSHRQNTLTFHVAKVAFSREQDVVYRYQLEGLGEPWQGPSSIPQAGIRYTSVPPGQYRFRIAAGWAESDLWSPVAESAAIVILKPVWLQPWFFALAAASAALSVLGIHRLRIRAIRARALELEAVNAKLNQYIRERQGLIAELEAKNAELERFTYTVSHDLKSPLVTIMGFLGFLKQDAAAGDEVKMHRDIGLIEDAAGKMGRLLDELLELSRIGRVVKEAAEVSITDLAHEAAELTGGLLAERGIEVEITPRMPVAFGDRTRLLEVLQNLIENAAKYMGDQPAPRIWVGVRTEGAEPVFFVRDNGTGIEPRYHDKVFGLFERLEEQTEGSGVGLALVKRIVEVHGGRIWVESEGRERGSTFCFTLPQARSPGGHGLLE